MPEIVDEIAEYITEPDANVARAAVAAIGKLGVRVPECGGGVVYASIGFWVLLVLLHLFVGLDQHFASSAAARQREKEKESRGKEEKVLEDHLISPRAQ